MGFLKWQYKQYKAYKFKKSLKPQKDRKDNLFFSSYRHCAEVGFTQEQLVALLNLIDSLKT